MKWSSEVTLDGHTMTAEDWLRQLREAGTPLETIAGMLKTTVDAVRNKSYALRQGSGQTEAMNITTEDNETTISATVPERVTAEDLLTAAGLDPNEWTVIRFRAGSWDVPAPDEDKDLVAEEGRWSGHVKKVSGVKTMYKYELTCVRTNPDVQTVSLAPIRAESVVPHITPSPWNQTRCKTVIAFADPQFGFRGRDPYHCREALSLVVQVVSREKPNHIVCLGDLLDLAQFQDRFLSDPASLMMTQAALAEAHYWLSAMRYASPMSTITVIEGNHDARLRNSVVKHLAAAYGLKRVTDNTFPVISVPYLLDLEGLHIDYISEWPKNAMSVGPSLKLEHGEKYSQAPGGTVAAILKNATRNTVAGHAHRLELAYKTMHEHDSIGQVFALVPGCVCKTDGSVPSKNSEPQWQQGMAMLYVHDSGLVIPEPMEIRDGRLGIMDRVMTHDAPDHYEAMRQKFPGTIP